MHNELQFQMQSSCKHLDMLFVQQASKQTQEHQNLILCQRIVVPFHHCTMKENANKSHRLLYL
jgi:hypothetical protein